MNVKTNMRTMKPAILLFFAGSLLGAPLFAQEEKKPDPAPPAKEAPAEQKPTQEELEAKFKTTLTGAVMSGRWCSVKDGVLGPEKEDKYTIIGVTKLLGDMWIVRARIQYGQRDLTVPVPVRVKWAGDTPVITVDDYGIPGGASYSARVLVYDQTYAGTWSGGAYGGLMNGIITPEKK